MSTGHWAEQIAIVLAALAIAARARSQPPLRPLAACLAALAALDLARLAAPPRSLDVALCAAWWPILTLAAVAPLARCWGPLAATAAGWWAITCTRLLAPPALDGPALAAEWWALWALATAAQCGGAAVWCWAAVRARRWPGEGEAVALVLCAGSVADAAGPWLWGPAGAVARWEVGRWQSACTWAAVCGVAIWHWRRER